MAKWCRNDTVVINSGLDAKYITTLNTIFARDYKSRRPFVKEYVSLDLDSYEKDQSGKNDCTMDGAIGVSKYDGHFHTCRTLLLVELRYDYLSANNLDRANMSRKIQHSKDLLAGQRVHDEYYFVFRDNAVSEAIRWIKNYSYQYSDMKSWIPVSVTSFDKIIGEESDFPYIPKTDLEALKKDVLTSASSIENLYEVLERWHNTESRFRLQYNIPEASAIHSALSAAMRIIVDNSLSDDPELAKDMYEEMIR